MRELIIKFIREGKMLIYKDIDSYNDVLFDFLEEVFPEDDGSYDIKNTAIYGNRYFSAMANNKQWTAKLGSESNLSIITLSEILYLPSKNSVNISREQWEMLMTAMDEDTDNDAETMRRKFKQIFDVQTNKAGVIDDIKKLMKTYSIRQSDLS